MELFKHDDLYLLDHPEILARLFYPRKDIPEVPIAPKAMTYFVEVESKVAIGCRFYPAGKGAPTILYFHGNGETASDYDGIAALYNEKGLNLFVADYRGYGLSTGTPTASHLVGDAHRLFEGCLRLRHELDYEGGVFVMGRSLGSVPALEVAFHYQDQLKGVIIESGFSSTQRLIDYFGVAHLFTGMPVLQGFGNGQKMQSVFLPTLVIHAEHDRLIPVAEGKELYALCGAQRKTLVIIPGADHNDVMLKGRERYFRAIETFISQESR